MIFINKCRYDGVELLPPPEDTPFWKDMDLTVMSSKELRNYNIYSAIRDVENYYQFHTPTAFGNPDYARAHGYLNGLLQGYGLDKQIIGDKIIIKTQKGVKLMVIERPQKPDAYFKEKEEISKLMGDI